ncbi:MAG: DMT family transporter [Bacteroidota bacterium]
MNSTKKIYTGVALVMMTVIIWSGNYVVAKGISKQLPAVSLAFYRWSLASICIMPFAIKKFVGERQIILANKSYIFWTAVTGVTIFNTFIYLGGHYTSAINLALIGTVSAPIFVTILSAFFLKEFIGLFRITGMVICFIGVLFLISQGSLQKLANFHFGKGDVMVLFSAFSFAIYSILVKKKPAAISPVVFLFTIFTLGTLVLFPFYIYETVNALVPVHWNGNMIATIFYLGIGNSIIGFFGWNAAIEKLGSTATALFANLIPVFSTIEAVLFLHEQFSFIHLISGVLVIGGVIIANITRPAKAVQTI